MRLALLVELANLDDRENDHACIAHAGPITEPRSFRSIGASYLTQLYDTDLLRNQSVSDVELARRVLGHQSRDSTVTYISNVLHGEPCTKVGVVRHAACDDLNEGSFAITPYDEDGATAVAVAPVVLTEDGKRRRVSVPSVDR